MTQLKSDHVKVHNALSTDGAQASYMLVLTVSPATDSAQQKQDSAKFSRLPFISSLKLRIISFKYPINYPWQELKNFVFILFQ